jgi:hypothetical protein
MITLQDFYKGRDKQYASELTAEIEGNALTTVQRANALLLQFGRSRAVHSGWRPAAVNAATPNAAPKSKHMKGQAVDLDDPEGDLDEWCLAHPEILEKIGLWQEHPASTKGWCHVQIVPPLSGKRVFYP